MSEPTVRFGRRPVDGPITQSFGDTYSGYPHRGVDFDADPGTPVYAPCAGTVVAFTNSQTQWQGQTVRSFGIGVCLAVGDGWWVLMAHLSQSLVNIGDIVREGQVIGYSGNTGVSTGPHLHWQLSDSPGFPTNISQSRDPLAYMEEEMTDEEFERRFDERFEERLAARLPNYLAAAFEDVSYKFSERSDIPEAPMTFPYRPWEADLTAIQRNSHVHQSIPGVSRDE